LSAQPAAPDWPRRFRFGQLRRRAFWPFWLAIALLALTLTVPWTAETTGSLYDPCAYSADCGYGDGGWTEDTTGGYGPHLWTFAILAIGGSALLWAAARREGPRPSWFGRVPIATVGGGVLVGVWNLEEAIPFAWFDTSTDVVWTGELGWGVALLLLAMWPLHVGLRRIRKALDGAPSG
jgi:hypothetical protein